MMSFVRYFMEEDILPKQIKTNIFPWNNTVAVEQQQ